MCAFTFVNEMILFLTILFCDFLFFCSLLFGTIAIFKKKDIWKIKRFKKIWEKQINNKKLYSNNKN